MDNSDIKFRSRQEMCWIGVAHEFGARLKSERRRRLKRSLLVFFLSFSTFGLFFTLVLRVRV